VAERPGTPGPHAQPSSSRRWVRELLSNQGRTENYTQETRAVRVVWSYFNNCTDNGEATFATRATWDVIYRDIGATVPT
jgi:hypothetical protein